MGLNLSEAELIGVMGPTGCGKTTFVNEASGSSFLVGKTLMSCTATVAPSEPFVLESGPEFWSSRPAAILIDTPRFDDTTRSDLDILKMIAEYLKKTYGGGQKLAGVIYMQRISDPRMGGTFIRNARMFRKLCGHPSMYNVVIATTFWGKVQVPEGQAREENLKADTFFGCALRRGATMMRHNGGKKTAHKIISNILNKGTPLPLRIQKQMVDKQKPLSSTDASQELHRILKEQLQQFHDEMKSLDEELQNAEAIGDTDTLQKIRSKSQDLQRRIDWKKADEKATLTFMSWFRSLR